MKKVWVGVLASSVVSHVYAIDGHNGIRFNMTQRDVEAKGFVCAPPKKEGREIAVCRHMELTGTAFGVATQNYEVTIGPDKRVADIRADLVGIRTVPEYLNLLSKVQDFFPKKDEAGTHSAQGLYMRDAWRAPDNSGASVFYASGVKGVTKDTMSVTFSSPSEMAAVDKLRAERERQKASQAKAAAEASPTPASTADATAK